MSDTVSWDGLLAEAETFTGRTCYFFMSGEKQLLRGVVSLAWSNNPETLFILLADVEKRIPGRDWVSIPHRMRSVMVDKNLCTRIVVDNDHTYFRSLFGPAVIGPPEPNRLPYFA